MTLKFFRFTFKKFEIGKMKKRRGSEPKRRRNFVESKRRKLPRDVDRTKSSNALRLRRRKPSAKYFFRKHQSNTITFGMKFEQMLF